MASIHELEMALNLVDRGAKVALTVGESNGEQLNIVVHLVSGCAVPKRIGFFTLTEASALALCTQLGEALAL